MNREVSNLFTYVTYVLKLEEDKWYVGLTANLKQRLTQHFTGDGAKWTKLFKPVEVVELYSGDREQEITERLMCQYGYRMVRGGNYCMVRDLTPKQMKRKLKKIAKGRVLSADEVMGLFSQA
jgi:hypothetical protein